MEEEDEIVTIPLLRTSLDSAAVQLIRIPPPLGLESEPEVSFWNDNDILWSGSLVFVELENITTHVVRGLIQYINADGSLFGETVFDPLEKQDILKTRSKWKYRVLLTHQDIKVALGLVWKDRIALDEFNDALKRLKRDVLMGGDEADEKEEEVDDGISGVVNSFTSLSMGNDTNIMIGIDLHSEEDDSDDDFGEFVN